MKALHVLQHTYRFILCDMKTLCFLLHAAYLCLSLPCFAPFETIDNGANERCKPLYITVYPVPCICMSRIYPPPYTGASVNIRPLPNFF